MRTTVGHPQVIFDRHLSRRPQRPPYFVQRLLLSLAQLGGRFEQIIRLRPSWTPILARLLASDSE